MVTEAFDAYLIAMDARNGVELAFEDLAAGNSVRKELTITADGDATLILSANGPSSGGDYLLRTRTPEEDERLAQLARDDGAWETARSAGTAAAYGEYLTEYPNGRHADEARRLLAEAKDDEAYERARAAGTTYAYGAYLRTYPNGRHAAEAWRQYEETKYRRVKSVGTSASYESYLRVFPDWPRADEVRRLLSEAKDDEAFAQAKAAGTQAAYGDYLRSYPSGRHAAAARRLRAEDDHGDIPDDATLLTTSVDGELGSGEDVDVFRFEVAPDAQWVTVYATGAIWPRVWVGRLAADGSVEQVMAGSSDPGDTTWLLTPGTYYAFVDQAGGGDEVGEYTVHLVSSNPDRLTASVDGKLSYDDVVDVYRVEVASDARLVTMMISSDGSAPDFSLVRVASDGSKELIASELLGWLTQQPIEWKYKLESGTYYVIAAMFRPDPDDETEYAVRVMAEDAPEDDHGDIPDDATLLTTSVDGELGSGEDVDVFRFEVAPDAQWVTVYATGAIWPRVRVGRLAADGSVEQVMAGSSDPGDTTWLLTPGTYYAFVDQAGGGDEVGEYTVHLVSSNPDRLTASVDGKLSYDDVVDVYRVEVASDARLVTMMISSDGSAPDFSLVRVASDGSKELIASELLGWLTQQPIEWKYKLESGTYYVIAAMFRPDPDDETEYAVRVMAEDAPEDDHGDIPDDATLLTTSVDGELGSGEDVDVFRFEVAPDAQWVTVYATGAIWPRVRVGRLAADGSVEQVMAGSSDPGDTTWLLTPGTYYAFVDQAGGGDEVGEYTVHLVSSNPDRLTASVDGKLSYDDVVDVYRVEVASDARLVTMMISSDGSAPDFSLVRVASDGSKELIASEFLGWLTQQPVEWKYKLESGTHYVIVAMFTPEPDDETEYAVQVMAEEAR